MKTFSVYHLGAIMLFLGFAWMLAPHAFHSNLLDEGQDVDHISHIIQGIVLVAAGIVVMVHSKGK